MPHPLTGLRARSPMDAGVPSGSNHAFVWDDEEPSAATVGPLPLLGDKQKRAAPSGKVAPCKLQGFRPCGAAEPIRVGQQPWTSLRGRDSSRPPGRRPISPATPPPGNGLRWRGPRARRARGRLGLADHPQYTGCKQGGVGGGQQVPGLGFGRARGEVVDRRTKNEVDDRRQE